MTSQKSEMLDAALRYLVKNGVANASLRPMAEAMGTSARMLLFHFESKEGLLRAVLQEVHGRLRASFLREVSRSAGKGPPIRRFWDWATHAQNSSYMRVLYEIQIIAAQNPDVYGRYLKGISSDWQALALDALSADLRSPSMASLCIAVFDGLFLEFMTTGDRERLGKALDLFIAMAAKGSSGKRSQ